MSPKNFFVGFVLLLLVLSQHGQVAVSLERMAKTKNQEGRGGGEGEGGGGE